MLKSKIRKKILKIRKERNFYNKKFNFLKIFNEIKKENIKVSIKSKIKKFSFFFIINIKDIKIILNP